MSPKIVWLALIALNLGAQSAGNISEFFEGRTVVLRLDMPGTNKGVDIYPQRPQPLDLKSYSNRVRDFGVALHNGDSVIVTKVRVKDDNIEFQLAGGGYGAFGDDTDTTVQFSPRDKSEHEKDLEHDLKDEKNPERRRHIQHELDEARSHRERRDDEERALAEQAAVAKQQIVFAKRLQGGSRFNLRMEYRKSAIEVTPPLIMSSLAKYVTFPGDPSARNASTVAPAPAQGEPALSLRKGLTRDQVESIYGKPAEAHETNQNGMAVVTCTYRDNDNVVKADFVNGVLVQYTVSSR